jgi:hypothetical protein
MQSSMKLGMSNAQMWHLYLWILLVGDSSNGFQPLSIGVKRFHEINFSYYKNNGPYCLNKKKDALLAQSKTWDEDYDDEDSKVHFNCKDFSISVIEQCIHNKFLLYTCSLTNRDHRLPTICYIHLPTLCVNIKTF